MFKKIIMGRLRFSEHMYFIYLFLFFALLLIFLSMLIPSVSALRINEVMYNPVDNDNNKEFIELYDDEVLLDLSNFTIGDLNQNDSLELVKFVDSNYALIVESGFIYDISNIDASVYSAGSTIGDNLNNEEDCVYFYNDHNNNSLEDYFCYDNSLADGNGRSLSYYDGDWLESDSINGTPGYENDCFIINEEYNITDLCDVSISINVDGMIFDNKEKIPYNHILSEDISDFTIEYWVEDIEGNFAKSKYNTTNINQKSWTPSISVPEKTFFLKAKLYTECNNSNSNITAEQMVIVKANITEEEYNKTTKETESSLRVILPDEDLEFGNKYKFIIDAYKGDTSKRVINLWVEDANLKKVSAENAKVYVYTKYTEAEFSVDLELKQCEGFDDPFFVVAEGLGEKFEQEISIEGYEDCKKENNENKGGAEGFDDSATGISYELVDFNNNISHPYNFDVKVKITNNDPESHEFSLYSYVYQNSKSFVLPRDLNRQNITISAKSDKIIVLKNDINADPGQYRFKVKIKKDDLKTEKELTEDIVFLDIANNTQNETSNSTNTTIDLKGLSEGSSELSQNTKANNQDSFGNKESTILDQDINASNTSSLIKIIYQSTSSKARGLILYFLFLVSALIILMLVVKWLK
ncbi:hypothetical protein ACFL0W_06740 [Nanoarchaeota archaeon]